MVIFKLHHSIRLGCIHSLLKDSKEMKENALFVYLGSMPEVSKFSVKGLDSITLSPNTERV